MTSDDILANAERLIADARHLHDVGRSRSAATLVVVALEQFGSFVEELTKEKFPDAVVHMGIFGDKANAHAKRQDALAGHVYNFVLGELSTQFMFEIFYHKTRCGDHEKFMQWLVNAAAPLAFSDKQKERMKSSKEMQSASLLMHFVREGRLKHLREYGLYENSELRFSPAAIQQVIELAEMVREILVRSRNVLVPEPMSLAGVNMPPGIIMDDEGEWLLKLNHRHQG
ncbi:MAG TPA: hypothetical protein VHT93_12665 [Pseudolabrys sp.]|jgi:hypothetical protein|nr:hypothetical protein [Pseudolabrys sp.]